MRRWEAAASMQQHRWGASASVVGSSAGVRPWRRWEVAALVGGRSVNRMRQSRCRPAESEVRSRAPRRMTRHLPQLGL